MFGFSKTIKRIESQLTELEGRLNTLSRENSELKDRVKYLEACVGDSVTYETGPYYYKHPHKFEGPSILARLKALPYKFEVTPPQKEKVIARKVE